MEMKDSKNHKKSGWITYHLKVFAGSIVMSVLFNVILTRQIDFQVVLSMFLPVFFQLEIFLWLGKRFFPDNMKNSSDPRKTTGLILMRLLLYYVTVMLIAAMIFILNLMVRSILQGDPFLHYLQSYSFTELKPLLNSTAIGFLIGIIIFFFFSWQEALKREYKLNEEKLLFRYETLKSQMNPHFLFNSLNTLASLVEVDPPAAGNYVARLAQLYRYLLDKQELDWVNLSDELQFAQNYFAMQEIRDKGKIALLTDVPQADNFEVMPLSLQLLLENVFKHNTASVEKPLIVRVFLEGNSLVVSNTLQRRSSWKSDSRLGLKNLGERYRLAYGKDIRITETEQEFRVTIPLRFRKDDVLKQKNPIIE
jgi:sensor histidine kinase YesM